VAHWRSAEYRRDEHAYRQHGGAAEGSRLTAGRSRVDDCRRTCRRAPDRLAVLHGPNEIAGPGLARFFDSMDDIVLVITQHDHAMDEIAALRRELGRNAEKIAACVVLDTAIFALKGVIANADHDITSAAARADYLDLLVGRLGDPALPAETPTAMPTLVAEAA
jgi:hypothetical protein